DFIDAFEYDGVLWSKTQADHDAYLAKKASEGLFPKLLPPKYYIGDVGLVRVKWVKKKKKLPRKKRTILSTCTTETRNAACRLIARIHGLTGPGPHGIPAVIEGSLSKEATVPQMTQ